MVEIFEAPASKLNLERLGLPNDLEAKRPVGVDLFFSELEQAKQRRELDQNLRHVFEQVKDVNLNFDQALDLGLIQPEDLTSIYHQLTEFVTIDENNSRILLYLPFQLLPKLNREKQLPKTVSASQVKFAKICRDAWVRLLFESEPRANFVDGDVLEEALGEPERGRKAGHLTADLLERGIIQTRLYVTISPRICQSFSFSKK